VVAALSSRTRWLAATRSSTTVGRARPPGPSGRFLAGNLQDYEEDRLGFLLDCRRDYGDLVSFDRRTTIVNHPDLAREVLVDSSGAFAIRQNFLLEDIPETELDAWLGVRRLMSPGLRRPVAEGFAPVIAQIVDDALADSLGQRIAATTLLEQVTSRSIARYCFGADDRDIPEAAGRLLDALAQVVGNPFALPATLPSPARFRIRRRLRELRFVLEPLVRARVAHPDAFSDYAATALARRDEAIGQSADRVLNVLIGTMLAGHRVPAAAMGWTLMLARNDASTWAALQLEAEVFQGCVTDGTFRLAAFPAARAAIKESLRLYPATWLISRQARVAVEVGSYQFSAGHHFLISPYVIHRDPNVFEDSEAFLPQRWEDGSAEMDRHYLPFGAGSRACPGSHLALTVMATALLTAARWDLRLHDADVHPNPRTTLLPAGLVLEVRARPTHPSPS